MSYNAHKLILFFCELYQILFRDVNEEMILEKDSIFEKNVSEHIYTSMKPRIEEFKTWLYDRKENFIVVVGHSAFFRDMLGVSIKMNNCEVKKCSLFAYNCAKSGVISSSGGSDVKMIGIKDEGTIYQGGESLLNGSDSW